jgi:hypothetical protein
MVVLLLTSRGSSQQAGRAKKNMQLLSSSDSGFWKGSLAWLRITKGPHLHLRLHAVQHEQRRARQFQPRLARYTPILSHQLFQHLSSKKKGLKNDLLLGLCKLA